MRKDFYFFCIGVCIEKHGRNDPTKFASGPIGLHLSTERLKFSRSFDLGMSMFMEGLISVLISVVKRAFPVI